MNHLLLIPHFAGGLFFWPVFRVWTRTKSPVSKQLFKIFLATLFVLGFVAGKIALFHEPQQWGAPLFSFVNFGSLLFSVVTWLRMNPARKQRLSEPRIAAMHGVGFVVTAVMLMGGFRNIDIFLHEARTTATVINSHRGVDYQFEVDGRIWGSGGQPPDPARTIEIRYSAPHPFFSTSQHPLTILGQMVVAALFVGTGAFGITRNAARKAREQAEAAEAKSK